MRWIAVLALAALMAASACSTSDGGQAASPTPSRTGEKWAVAYNQTTCEQWANEMTHEQRRTAARELLDEVRANPDPMKPPVATPSADGRQALKMLTWMDAECAGRSHLMNLTAVADRVVIDHYDELLR